MKNKGLILIFVLALIIIISAVYYQYKPDNNYEINKTESNLCQMDSDCVPAGVCHSTSCTVKANAPNTTGIFCTAVCEPGTLDCGQGECKCINNKCKAIFK